MSRVAVSTDTVCSLPPPLTRERGIALVPILLEIEGRSFKDTELEPHVLYALARKLGRPPRTASPPPAVFRDLFSALLEYHDAVFHITYSSNLGAAYGFALQAAKGFPPGRIEVFDSGLAVMAQGFVALAAADKAREQADLSEVRAAAERVARAARAVFFLDTLEFLRYSGRVPAAVAWIGDLIGIKPVAQIAAGKISLLTRVRTRKHALEYLVRLPAQNAGNRLHLAVMHATCEDDAQKLAQALEEAYRPVELLVSELSAFVGVHAGPGAVGIAYYWE